jgi:UDP-N-acetylglucosamine:LPS N-acetylglucosamine transferase
MLVVPFPHAAAQHRANAAELVDGGAALLVEVADLDGVTLRQACDLLFDDRLAAMAEAARSVGRPGSAVAGAELLVALAKGGPLPAQSELDAIVGAQPA